MTTFKFKIGDKLRIKLHGKIDSIPTTIEHDVFVTGTYLQPKEYDFAEAYYFLSDHPNGASDAGRGGYNVCEAELLNAKTYSATLLQPQTQ